MEVSAIVMLPVPADDFGTFPEQPEHVGRMFYEVTRGQLRLTRGTRILKITCDVSDSAQYEETYDEVVAALREHAPHLVPPHGFVDSVVMGHEHYKMPESKIDAIWRMAHPRKPGKPPTARIAQTWRVEIDGYRLSVCWDNEDEAYDVHVTRSIRPGEDFDVASFSGPLYEFLQQF